MPDKVPPASGRLRKGQTNNRRGSSALQRARRELADKAKAINVVELIEHSTHCLRAPIVELAEIAGDEHNQPSNRAIVAKGLYKSYIDGNFDFYFRLLDRCVGKPRESQSIELTGKDGGPIASTNMVSTMSTDELRAELDKLRARRKKRSNKDG